MKVAFKVNGKPVTAEVEPNTLLVDYIRNKLSLTGTHVGCDTSQCGACKVLLDGKPVKACALLMAQVEAKDVNTPQDNVNDDIHASAAYRTRLIGVMAKRTVEGISG